MCENENIEVWRDIENYEGLYQVSNMGQVKSLRDNNGRHREKILRPGTNRKGYLLVVLYKNGKHKAYYIHRLVATAFIENPLNLPTVNHIDENPSNNNVTNLEWCDVKYNINYGTAQARRVANTDYTKIDYKARTANTDYKARTANTDYTKIDYNEVSQKRTEKLSRQVYQYTKDKQLIKIWDSTAECGRNGFHQGNVAACCRGILKQYKGYLWSYTEI